MIALSASAALVSPARAADVPLVGDSSWRSFAADSLVAPAGQSLAWIDDSGAQLAFTFVIGAGTTGSLTVVDAGFAGDVFAIANFATLLGSTSAVPMGAFETAHDIGADFEAALADPAFSRRILVLDPGAYRITGMLTQSVTFDGEALNATVGGVRLSVMSPIPEPSSLALLAAGLSAFGFMARRRRSWMR